MAITASRLGSTPFTLDWSGIPRKYDPDPQALNGAWERLRARFQSQEIGFYNAPLDPVLSQIEACQSLAKTVLARGFKSCLCLGIGGSALGPISLLSALQEKCSSGIEFHFLENPDPLEWKKLSRTLNPETTLVCAITKSGTTFETLAQVALALEWLKKERWQTHLVMITDPSKGDLRAFAQQEAIPSLSIAPSIGGRFSIFTPVGLFPALIAGLSAESFLKGAKQVHDFIEKTPPEKNALFIIASHLLQHAPKRSIHVCMPYSSRLRLFGDWFAQLWGESLGKDGKGFTPVAALGATDQHSLLQLLRDGPDDKITGFITLGQIADEVKIPKGPEKKAEWKGFPGFQILEGHTLHELLTIEYRAVATVLTKQNRPHWTIHLDRLDETSLGSLYFAYCVLTSITGTLWDLNPFDQPGVEEGKIYIHESLQKKPEGAFSGADQTHDDDDNSPVARLRRHTRESD